MVSLKRGDAILKKIATIDNVFNKAYSRTQIRKSSRAIILKNNLILMIHSKKNGDFKFPGGGRKVFESPIDNLIRETKEETGYDVVRSSIRPLGYVEELNRASNNKNALFKMISEYYFCDIESNRELPLLDDYEKKLDYQAVFVSPDYALKMNGSLDIKKFHWVVRENLILKIIIRMLGDNNESINML